MGAVLGVGAAAVDGLAWDVYLAYPRGEAYIRRPGFWMHQLDLAHAPRLTPSAFRQGVGAFLDAR